uniref:Uncharacterized protein n=1 Tax=Theropithecus gelada TaxID=9565 RepID=A0A8D2GMB5_THEGE
MEKIVIYPWAHLTSRPLPSCVLCPMGCTSAPCGSLPPSLRSGPKCPEPLNPTATPLYPGSAVLLLHDVRLPTGMNVDISFSAVRQHPEQDWNPGQAPGC